MGTVLGRQIQELVGAKEVQEGPSSAYAAASPFLSPPLSAAVVAVAIYVVIFIFFAIYQRAPRVRDMDLPSVMLVSDDVTLR